MLDEYLLDVNITIALADGGHEHSQQAHKWFGSRGKASWGVCPLTQAGFMRITTNPALGTRQRTLSEARDILVQLERLPGYRFWPIAHSWAELTAPFSSRIFGHQQITDAYLLGLAIKHRGVLVTFDSGLKFLAGSTHAKHLLVLE